MYEQNSERALYIPYIPILKVTAVHKLGRLPIALSSKPECCCGIAKRVGYTGTCVDDLAIFRLSVKISGATHATMLPILFVVEKGVFLEYEEWLKSNERELANASTPQRAFVTR